MKAYIYTMEKDATGVNSEVIIIAKNKKVADSILNERFFKNLNVKKSLFEISCKIKEIEEGMLYGILL